MEHVYQTEHSSAKVKNIVCNVYLLSGMHWPITNLNPSQHFLLEEKSDMGKL